MPNIPGPITIGGIPVPGIFASPNARGLLPGGRVRFVCNRSGVTAGNGTTPDRPYATVDEAIADLVTGSVTSQGDCIYVLQGHAESISSADFWDSLSTLAGLSICGIGTGTMRPSFTWTVAGSTVLLDTDDLEIANCQLFLAGAHAAGSALTVTAPITVSGDGCRIVDNAIWWGYDANQIVGDGIIWTGDDGVFAGNRAIALVAAVPTNSFLILTGADRMLIENNHIEGATDATTKGVIDGETTESLNVKIQFNYIANLLASSTIAVSPVASTTGVARYNSFFVNSGILPITASLLEWHENYCVDTVGLAGALVGTASS